MRGGGEGAQSSLSVGVSFVINSIFTICLLVSASFPSCSFFFFTFHFISNFLCSLILLGSLNSGCGTGELICVGREAAVDSFWLVDISSSPEDINIVLRMKSLAEVHFSTGGGGGGTVILGIS